MRKLLFIAVLLLLPAGASAQTVDDIINKYLTARGGLERVRAMQSERVSGTISFGPGADGPFFVERKRPLKLHMEVTFGQLTLIRTYDGKSTGWTYNPFTPKPAVLPLSESELANIIDEADFEGPFIDYKSKGNKIELEGKDEVEGKPVNKLKLTNKNGDVSHFSFDVTSSLLLRWQGTRKDNDKDVPWESYFRDYREVNGLKYPFLIESNAPGTEQTQKIIADKIEINIPIDDNRFGKPTVPPAPAAPAEPAKPN